MTRAEEITMAADAASRYESPSFFEAFVTGAEWADQHPHWNSVEDELPPTSDRDDMSGDYLIVDEDGDMNVGHYNKMDKTWFSCDGYILDATHWMPLPKMPILSKSSNTGKYLKGGDNG